MPLVSHPPPAWLPMPTLAPTLGISDPSGSRTLPSTGTSPRPLLVPTAGTSTWQSPLAARLTTPTGTSTWQSPVAQPRPATRSEPVAARPGAADAKAASDEVRAVPGQGPLWQPPSQEKGGSEKVRKTGYPQARFKGFHLLKRICVGVEGNLSLVEIVFILFRGLEQMEEGK